MSKIFPVIGIGASAGGLEAVQTLLAELPPEPGMAFVLVQHLDPTHASELPHILARSTGMPVQQASDGSEIRPNHFYVIAPGAALEISGGRFCESPRAPDGHPEFLIDRFFRSLALDMQARAVAVILSGSGSDGALGMCEVKAAGGVTLAQDEATAGHRNMPQAAAQSGCVDFILPPREIAACLLRLGNHRYLTVTEPPDDGGDSAYEAVIDYVSQVTGVDYRLYRSTTIRRRISRRAMLFGHDSIARYEEQLKADPAEVQALHFDLLINVTSFFRDPAVFEALEHSVIPAILASKPDGEAVRVWVAGCSTGQEAYSIAMLLVEATHGRTGRQIQIFATDLSGEEILSKARAGVYTDSIQREVTPARLERFFDREARGYRIKKSLRDLCVFAQQNITSDPPFSRVDILLCRNVLIYMSPALQQRVLPIFHYALNAPGYLVLGSAETVGSFAHHFELLDRTAKIYRKNSRATLASPVPSPALPRTRNMLLATPEQAPALGDIHDGADRLLLDRYAPPGVMIDEDLNILEFRGRTGRYLEMPAGQPSSNLLRLAQDALIMELRVGIKAAQAANGPIVRRGVSVRASGVTRRVDLEIIPMAVSGGRQQCFLVMFQDPGSPPPGAFHRAAAGETRPGFRGWLARLRSSGTASPDATETSGRIERLQQEHEATRDFLQQLLDERESSNEELRAANEEVLSSNEELQSTNEELETTKEELQSVNEELTTVNEQLTIRNTELSQINSDFSNLLASSDIPLVAVSSDLRIRFHTPAATTKMNLLPSDIGRPLGHIRPAVAVANLEELVRKVIETQEPLHEEVHDRDDRWHLLRIYPSCKGSRADGAVIVLVDIDDIKRSQHVLLQQASMLKIADQRKNEFLAMLGHELRNPLGPMANVLQILRMPETADVQREEVLGVLDRQLAQLTRIVEDLLDAARISQGKIELRREQLDINTVLSAALETSRPSLDASGHRLEIQFCPTPVYVNADPLRMTQVLVNLLNNAAKFTPKNGLIQLTCRIVASTPPQVIISVRDNGIGMSPELLSHVFELFTQGDTFENRRRGGLGIGLTLVRTLVEMHGGRIEATSGGEGQGSEFIVHLPAAQTAPHAEAVDTERIASGPAAARRILVIEDNLDQAHTLTALLALWGHEVTSANEGAAGVELAQTFKPDIVLVDLGLPGISGYEVARRIRKLPELEKVCIVAQTGWGDTTDRRRTREAGFDHHLLKPLDPEELRSVIARLRH